MECRPLTTAAFRPSEQRPRYGLASRACLALWVCLATAGFAAPAHAANSADSSLAAARQMLEQTRFGAADSLATTLLAQAERQHGPDSREVAQVLEVLTLEVELSWIDDYPKKVAELSLKQVNGTIKRYVDTDKFVVVRAGTFKAK